MTLRGLAALAACAVAIDDACSIDDACDTDAVLIDDVRACELGGQCVVRWRGGSRCAAIHLEVARGDGELLAAADSPNDGLELFSFAEDYAPGPHVVRVACRNAAATAPFDVVAAAPRVATTCRTDAGVLAPCGPGAEGCRDVDGPRFHVVDRSGCAINDPAAPARDPRHGGFHVFYQKRVAAPGGAGPVWGHAVSADLVTWASLPAALWNDGGDGDAVLTGSALPGDDLKLLYAARAAVGAPVHWRVAAPADDADELLVDWRKGAVVAADASRDPATPWRVFFDEWRTVAYDGITYGSTDGFLETSYAVGREFGPRACECPTLFPLPRTRDGAADASWPTHVFKRSCQEDDGAYDQWRLGTYDATRPGEAGAFVAVSGWRRVDAGFYYASKDAADGVRRFLEVDRGHPKRPDEDHQNGESAHELVLRRVAGQREVVAEPGLGAAILLVELEARPERAEHLRGHGRVHQVAPDERDLRHERADAEPLLQGQGLVAPHEGEVAEPQRADDAEREVARGCRPRKSPAPTRRRRSRGTPVRRRRCRRAGRGLRRGRGRPSWAAGSSSSWTPRR